MDPFEVRMQFLTQLRRLTASQQSIQKVVSYALKYFSRCGEDLWECIVEECEKGTLNMRMNILHLLDSLCETALTTDSRKSSANPSDRLSYTGFVARDLEKIIQLVVPDTRDGLINLMSTRQILESWRSKRVLDPNLLDEAVKTLDRRKETLHGTTSSSTRTSNFSREDIFKRLEEDRERHKLLRQKRWWVPNPTATSSSTSAAARLLASTTTPSPSTPSRNPNLNHPNATMPEDIEFENAWETTSDWNEDDDEAVLEENELCEGGAGLGANDMDTSQ